VRWTTSAAERDTLAQLLTILMYTLDAAMDTYKRRENPAVMHTAAFTQRGGGQLLSATNARMSQTLSAQATEHSSCRDGIRQ
jgi:hypothetical protein